MVDRSSSCRTPRNEWVNNSFALFVSFLESSQKESPGATGDEKDSCDALEAQVLSLSQVVRDNMAEFIKHVHGSHVVRTLLHVLAGCLGPPRIESRPGTRAQILCVFLDSMGKDVDHNYCLPFEI